MKETDGDGGGWRKTVDFCVGQRRCKGTQRVALTARCDVRSPDGHEWKSAGLVDEGAGQTC